ncbi:hypothetical protein N7493_006873 [Penicillium malachiteum]|uniref:Uncharacterized protein n=1 Tax=Penicillium malachiteum TaxID=1324776 RepID=A0AAD6MUZ3_9EURO|nr:hypothetical protein N7493_006873 [Penicillium malachiteum]
MKWLASSTFSSSLLLRYCPQNVIPPVAQRYLGSPFHPIRPKIAHMHATRDPNTLWWRASVAPIGDLKRVVRSWCARKARLALQQALRNHGFDDLGRPLSDFPVPQKYNLTGSLEVIVRPNGVGQSFETFRDDADHLLGHILRLRSAHLERASKNPAKNLKSGKPSKKSKSKS